ncbi:MAG: hypothetical protein USCAAHI_01550 [Beijerinckiaceae bacterium]|nr:MAG: hypothetical protein USCAAHI_01550 [Beijerinckiaceae bacterium]
MPGSPLDPRAEGANDLLRDGATFCTKAEDVTNALAEQNLSREQPDAGFFEPGFASGPYEPLGNELDLAEVAAAAPFVPVPQELDNAAPKAASAGEGSPAAKPAVRPQNIERRLIELLGPVPVQVDELAGMAEIPAREVRTVLLALKLAGKVEWYGGDLGSSLPTAWPRANYHEE